MARVLTFSRVYPSYHPKAGELTYFVEKIMAGLADTRNPYWQMKKDFVDYNWCQYYNCRLPKHHTIRAGHRWKVGDWFSPRVWSGKPYASKQIQFAPDIQVKKVWGIEIKELPSKNLYALQFYLNGNLVNEGVQEFVNRLSKNDGLPEFDFIDWFVLSSSFKKTKEFSGQIICWNESIEY